jgi:hypothetical protein
MAGRGTIKSMGVTALAMTRAIPTARLRQAALLPLLGDNITLNDLAELESATNPRLTTVDGRPLEIHPDELVPAGVAGATIINAAFMHPPRGGARFNSERRGAWYGADTIETCLAEVGHHMEQELAATGWPSPAIVEYSALHVQAEGPFADLMGLANDPALDPDPAVGYPAGQALAAQLVRQGLNGAAYPSARALGERCFVIFRPRAISNFREGTIYRLEWTGGPGPKISKLTA